MHGLNQHHLAKISLGARGQTALARLAGCGARLRIGV